MTQDEDEIDIKEVVLTILNYKKSIFIITAIFTLLSFIYAYFSPNIYRSHALVKITSGDNNSYQGDLASIAMGRSENNIDDKIVVFQTSNIANKALKKLYFVDMQLKAINQTLQGSADKLQSFKD
ncbi:MAG: Wzz/FepE/Etk N-terminal domain-containing protein [Sulfurovum sp.]|nr:Wzz/FepE/Etk N-terminal domain-containing protein [Sulfurovum sp.]